MKILHVSNFVQKDNGRLFWNTPFRISNGFTRLGHNVLNFSVRDIARENIFNSTKFGKSKLNERLLTTCINYNPDLIVLGHADLVSIDTLDEIRFKIKKLKIINWNVDHLLMNDTLNKIKYFSKVVDSTFVTTGDKIIAGLSNHKMNISFIPNIFDNSIDSLKIFENEHYEYDIFFAMSHGVGSGVLKKNKSDGREKLLLYIDNQDNINTNFFGFNNIQPIWGNKFYQEIIKAPMGLNLSQGETLKLYSSDRLSSYIGNGLLTFLDAKYDFQNLYTDEEVVFYETKEELVDKISFYSVNSDSRRKIAFNGWLKSHKNFNGVNICEYMLNKVFDNKTNNYWQEISY